MLIFIHTSRKINNLRQKIDLYQANNIKILALSIQYLNNIEVN
jgi:hypothetical protein